MNTMTIKVGDMIQFDKFIPGQGLKSIMAEVIKVDEYQITLETGDVFHLLKRVG